MAKPADRLWVGNWNAIHAVCFVAGISVGFLSRLFRPYILGSIHFEALSELGLKIAISITVLWLASNSRTHRPVQRFTLSVLALWIGSAIGWSILNGSMWTEHLIVNASGCLITLALGLAWIWLVANVRRR